LSSEFGFEAAVRLRLRTAPARLALMAAITVMLSTIGHWRLAPSWFAAYVSLQALIAAFSVGPSADIERRRSLHYGLSALNFALAGVPTWHMWTTCGELGSAASVMFLCGMLIQQIVASLGARRLFWFSAAPLIAYLVILPPLAWGQGRLVEGLTLTGCGLCLVTYLAVLWGGYQRALRRWEADRSQAVEARDAAEHAARAKSNFLATMSHEVRTPMNAVLGAAGLLRKTRLDVPQAEYVEMISGAGSVLMNVLDDILDLSKIEAGKLQVLPAPADLDALVRRCADLWAPQAEQAGLAFDLTIQPGVPSWIVVDPARLSQILFNLLSNAVKFTPSGRVGLTVAAAGEPGRTTLTFTISDTGCGIAPDAMPRLFGAFEQADAGVSRQFGGTGLGLAISQQLAGLMGGAITARSEAGQGSRFELRLPVDIATPANDPAALSADQDLARPGLRILVAEDNPVNRKIVEAMLLPLEAAITFAHNGAEAVEAFRAHVFDIVLMDIQMPVMDGLEATRRIRALGGPGARTPVIAITANVMEDQRKAYGEAGVDMVVAKPIDAGRLLAAICTLASAPSAILERVAG
jgi:two-component system, sensor histidine kinase